jgi:hypothetical protein
MPAARCWSSSRFQLDMLPHGNIVRWFGRAMVTSDRCRKLGVEQEAVKSEGRVLDEHVKSEVDGHDAQ